MPLTFSLDRIGPLCRTVEDAAIVLSAINDSSAAYPDRTPIGFEYDHRIDLSKLRVGYSPAWFERLGFERGKGLPVSDAHLNTLDALRSLGISLVELELPDLPYEALQSCLYVEAAAIFEHLTLSGLDAMVRNSWPTAWRQTRLLSAVDYLQAERFRRQVMQSIDDLFARVDALFAPTYGSFPLLMVMNFTGHPGLTLRAGFTESPARGLGFELADPLGPPHRITSNVALHGRLFAEGTILALAHALEQRLGVWSERPPVD